MAIVITPPPNHQIEVVDEKRRGTSQWYEWFRQIGNLFKSGFTGTVILAKITAGGANGSLTVVNGIITTYVAPT